MKTEEICHSSQKLSCCQPYCLYPVVFHVLLVIAIYFLSQQPAMNVPISRPDT
jgi:hypothetical protein